MTKNAQNESDGARKCVFMELQTIFEKFEVLTDEELMEVRGGGGLINYSQNYISSVLLGSGNVINDIYDR